MKPFLKWVGGKTQLLPEILPRIPKKFDRYCEPFLGGGAVFFALRRQGFQGPAFLLDGNGTLITTYELVRDHSEVVAEGLLALPASKDAYYRIRDDDIYAVGELLSADASRIGLDAHSFARDAIRFIYLNKLGYNGLHRVNRKGKFNVPYGHPTDPAKRLAQAAHAVRQASSSLAGTTLLHRYSPFLESGGHLPFLDAGDFVYFDPPYDGPKNAFVGYSARGFDRKQQEYLAHAYDALTLRGVQCMLSNADTEWVRQRYSAYTIVPVQARRSVNSDPTGRGKVGEVLVLNYTP